MGLFARTRNRQPPASEIKRLGDAVHVKTTNAAGERYLCSVNFTGCTRTHIYIRSSRAICVCGNYSAARMGDNTARTYLQSHLDPRTHRYWRSRFPTTTRIIKQTPPPKAIARQPHPAPGRRTAASTGPTEPSPRKLTLSAWKVSMHTTPPPPPSAVTSRAEPQPRPPPPHPSHPSIGSAQLKSSSSSLARSAATCSLSAGSIDPRYATTLLSLRSSAFCARGRFYG